MKSRYLIRLDDACPTMSREKWDRMESLLYKYGIKPMVGVIPDCQDPKLKFDTTDVLFWEKVSRWDKNEWTIAMHGCHHLYDSDDKGINPFWHRSEFAGHSLQKQKGLIRKGLSVFHYHSIYPKYFYAPSHTFDENTLRALEEESDIRTISDTIGRCPYRKDGFFFIPQIFGHCVDVPIKGIYSFCFHPNTMSDEAFESLEEFLRFHKKQFVSFAEINHLHYGEKKRVDKVLSWAFFTYRKIRGRR